MSLYWPNRKSIEGPKNSMTVTRLNAGKMREGGRAPFGTGFGFGRSDPKISVDCWTWEEWEEPACGVGYFFYLSIWREYTIHDRRPHCIWRLDAGQTPAVEHYCWNKQILKRSVTLCNESHVTVAETKHYIVGTDSMRMELQGNCLESSLPVTSPPVLTNPM